MRYINRILLAGFFSLLLSEHTFGQEGMWTLNDCILHAKENNITYKQSRLNIESAISDLTQSKLNLLPTLDFSGSHSFNFGRSVDPTTYTFSTGNFQSTSFSLSSNFVLFNGFSKRNTIRLNEHNIKASEYNAENVLHEINVAITQAYLQALLNNEQVSIARQQLDISRQQEEVTKKLVDAGSLPEGNLLEIKAQVAQNEYILVNAENQYDLSLVNLQLMLDLSPKPDFSISGLTEEINTGALDTYGSANDIYIKALGSQPAIKYATESVHIADYNQKIAKSYGLPSLSLFGGLNTGSVNTRELYDVEFVGIDTIGVVPMTGDIVIADEFAYKLVPKPYPVFDQFNDNISQAYGISLRVPIFSGGQVRNAVQKARINTQQAALNLELVQNQLRNDIEQYHANTVAAARQYEAAMQNLEAVSKSFEYIRLKAAQGLVKPVDFTTAQANYQIAQSNVAQAKYTFILGLRILDFYLGNKLNID